MNLIPHLVTRYRAAVVTYGILFVVASEQVVRAACAPPANDGKGVLVNGTVTGGFGCYLEALLVQNMPYVILVAVILVVISGIQYMFAQGNPSEQGKAKQRIIGVVIGIIFYFLIRYLAPLVSSQIRL